MASEDYVREKLAVAIDALASSAAPLEDRLHNALISGLIRLQSDDFVDDESRAKFGAIMDLATWQEAEADEGTIRATLDRLSDDQLRSLASLIVELDSHYRPLWFFVGKSITDTD